MSKKIYWTIEKTKFEAEEIYMSIKRTTLFHKLENIYI